MAPNNPAYAVVSIAEGYGFGHVNIWVYDLLVTTSSNLLVTAQTGGFHHHDGSYGWEYGIRSEYANLTTTALHQAYLLMKRLDREMRKAKAIHSHETFADFALDVLMVAGIKKAYIREFLTMSGGIEHLPCFVIRQDMDGLKAEITRLENKLQGIS